MACVPDADPLTCSTGKSEPLYRYQWGLNHAESHFAELVSSVSGRQQTAFYDLVKGRDLRVEPVHSSGVKGQGVKVLVLDDGVQAGHEDLSLDLSFSFNFQTGAADPTPPTDEANIDAAHGTNAAGIIAATQNERGVMGIAPRVTLGGSRFLVNEGDALRAYGGAPFSEATDVINASFGSNPPEPPSFDGMDANANTTALRNLPLLRNGKGLLFVKASGNEFDEFQGRNCPAGVRQTLSCENPAHDTEALELTAIVVGAANSNGVKSSYSNAGSVNWVVGLGGEFGSGGEYGEGNVDAAPEPGIGPIMFSTDLIGCQLGYSRTTATDTAFLRGETLRGGVNENPNCDFSQMNGTSAATPTVSGVVALMLQANPDLTWRDVRDILARTSFKLDPEYDREGSRGHLFDLTRAGDAIQSQPPNGVSGPDADIQEGSTAVRLERGWIRNAAGLEYSNWYGFGLVDAEAAVSAARARTQTLPAQLDLPAFDSLTYSGGGAAISELRYGQVQRLGQFQITSDHLVDAVQIRLSGAVCIGSMGIFVKSPSGTVSALAVPYNIYYNSGAGAVENFGLSTYALYGEPAAGVWEVFAVSAIPGVVGSEEDPNRVVQACASYQPNGGTTTVDLTALQPLRVEYRVVTQPTPMPKS